MEETLLEKLKRYSSSDFYPLHMPGHKRKMQAKELPCAIDITEIDGFDNLHHAEGVLLAAQQRAARLYGAEETFYLVNGSTCGILSAVSAAVRQGGTLLMARNCHKAVYHAVLLGRLHAEYLYPPSDMRRGLNGSIPAEDVKRALEEMQRKGIRPDAVLITSPTYDGVVSDVRTIAEEVHRAGAVLIVDEAHGAHFAMSPYFPRSALECGADLVIHSVHKTLPSLTQTALLHVQGARVDRDRLRRYLGIYQTSSPSYVLMAGIDNCVYLMLRERKTLYRSFVGGLEQMRETLGQMKTLQLVTGEEPELKAWAYDRSKVIISTWKSPVDGPKLANLLRTEYHLEVEMASRESVTAIMTVSDTEEGFRRLTEALLELDDRFSGEQDDGAANTASSCVSLRCETVMTIADAADSLQETVALAGSAGRISAEFVYLYPPGIPILVPGERIPEDIRTILEYDRSHGLSVQGMADFTGQTIRVVSAV